jgi:hypothetical protein
MKSETPIHISIESRRELSIPHHIVHKYSHGLHGLLHHSCVGIATLERPALSAVPASSSHLIKWHIPTHIPNPTIEARCKILVKHNRAHGLAGHSDGHPPTHTKHIITHHRIWHHTILRAYAHHTWYASESKLVHAHTHTHTHRHSHSHGSPHLPAHTHTWTLRASHSVQSSGHRRWPLKSHVQWLAKHVIRSGRLRMW